MRQENDLLFLLSTLHPLYRNEYTSTEKAIWESKIDIKRILKKAVENEVAGSFVQLIVREGFSDPILHIALARFNKSIVLLKRTLDLIWKLSEELGKDILVIKLHPPYPLMFDDVDILVRQEDFRDVVRALETRGMRDISRQTRLAQIKRLQHRNQEVSMWKKGFWEIELYTDFSWSRLPSLNTSFCWRNTRSVNIFGIECQVPSLEAELLILVNHAIFKEGKVTLRDFLYINFILDKKTDVKIPYAEAKNFGWEQSFQVLISKLREWYKFSLNEIPSKNLCFPYLLPLKMICYSVSKLLLTSFARGGRLHLFTPLGYGLSLSWMMKQRINRNRNSPF